MRPLRLEKAGIRGLGIAESFPRGGTVSTLAGVVYRGDGVVDGFVFGRSTVFGDDATRAVADMYRGTKRGDINYVMIWGSIISRYNIVDVRGVSELAGVPALALSRPARGDIAGAISRLHPQKMPRYRALQERRRIPLRTGHSVCVRAHGCTWPQARRLLDSTTSCGAVPEPVRLAKLLAASLALGGGPAAVHVEDGSGDP